MVLPQRDAKDVAVAGDMFGARQERKMQQIMFNPDENWDARKIGRRLDDGFSKSDVIRMRGGEAADSTDWASWRNRFDQILDLFNKTDNDVSK